MKPRELDLPPEAIFVSVTAVASKYHLGVGEVGELLKGGLVHGTGRGGNPKDEWLVSMEAVVAYLADRLSAAMALKTAKTTARPACQPWHN